MYVPRFFVSSQQRFGATDIKALGTLQLSGLGQTVLQLLGKSVLQLHFIYKIAGESKTRREESGVHGEGERERERERERESAHMNAGERVRERERERERDSKSESESESERLPACTWERESERKRFGSSFYMFFPPPGPALYKLGLARSAVCSVCSA